MSNKALTETLEEFGLAEVFFGPEGFRIYTKVELAEAQLGYAKHPDGNDLTGLAPGDWKKEWVVFGYDPDLGDPYFVDTSKKSLPVFTAMHGTGSWEPSDVSPALRNFLNCLARLRSMSSQDNSLIEPTKTTLKDKNKLRALEQELAKLNGNAMFWNGFFERYREWLDENDS